MSRTGASLVVIGEIVTTATPAGLQRAEAIGIAEGRVVSAGTRADVLEAATAGARVLDVGPRAVLPGLHDFHLHLVGMARARREVTLDDAASFPAVVEALAAATGWLLEGDAWLSGRGWRETVLAAGNLRELDAALGGRLALLYSHDGHSAWASPAALRAAGIDAATPDPDGGRIEHGSDGEPNGLLRERATDLVDLVAGRLAGRELDAALVETVAELAGQGITGAVDAGDSTADNGVGEYAVLGDRASILAGAGDRLDGRLRLTVNMPAAAIAAAAELGLRTGEPLPGATTVRLGWAKAFVDGALGSRTAALFEPYSCGPQAQTGIARLTEAELDEIVAAGRAARIGLAVHAIGDRGISLVLDAFERASPRPGDAPPDRMEHLQLLRPQDVARLASSDITASLQPVHCASDRAMVDACWQGREEHAYPWRSLAASGARLAFGSDAPIESANPWLGIFAALHRRTPADGTPDWHPEQALTIEAAIAGYTSGPAAAAGRSDEGHLRPGAQADLAVLNVDLATLRRGDDALADVRSDLTLVAGQEVHRS
jgi:predicted amidohydrolase YtcJ